MNKIILLATLTKDVELRYLQSGSAMATLNLAHNKKFKKQDGSQSERVLYVKATCFGKTAEMVNQYFSKGSRILISGELTLNSWADDKGNKRSEHSILIETIDFIDRVPMGDFMDKDYKELLDLMFDDFDEFKDYILTNGYGNVNPSYLYSEASLHEFTEAMEFLKADAERYKL